MKLTKLLTLLGAICLLSACGDEETTITEFIETYKSPVTITCNDHGGYTYFEDIEHLIETARKRDLKACLVVGDDYVFLGVGPCLPCEYLPNSTENTAE